MNKKNFSRIILLFGSLIFLSSFAAADSFDDLLIQEKQSSQLIHELYTAHGNAVMGNKTKPSVIIVDIFDNNCAYCRISARALKELVLRNPHIQVVFKEYPILGEDSEIAARAAYAAEKQNKYLLMHNAMMEDPNHLDLSEIKYLAKKIHLDWQKLASDLEDEMISKQLMRNELLAEKLSIQSVPALFISSAHILTAKDPTTVPQYRWFGSIEDPRFSSLLQSVEQSSA